MIASTEPEYDDFNRSTQILLRHGFVFKVMPQEQLPAPSSRRLSDNQSQKSRSLSPVGVAPSSRVGEPHGIGRARSDGVVPSRRVTWDLSDLAGRIPELPFATKQLPQPESSSSRASRKLQRRSTVAAADVAERIVLKQERQELELLRQLHSSSATNDHQTSQQHEYNIEAPTMQRRKSSRERRALRRRSTATTVNMSNETWVDELLRNESEEKIMPQKKLRPYNGYRDDYFLGDVVRSTSHMIIESTPKQALRAVESLNVHDFAWVKRSDGLYTYAILAYRSTCPLTIESACASPSADAPVSSSEGEEYMYFVVDDYGSTKMVPKSRWHVNVRLMKPVKIKITIQ